MRRWLPRLPAARCRGILSSGGAIANRPGCSRAAAEPRVGNKTNQNPASWRGGSDESCFITGFRFLLPPGWIGDSLHILQFNMSDSFTSIYVHIIFHIKSTGYTMEETHLPRIFDYIGGLIRAESGKSCIVGGTPDHIHILASMPASTSLSDFVRAIKANTSRWIKGLGSQYDNFSWQTGYGAFSVSESNKEPVRNYILNQKTHHLKHSAHEEFCQFLERHGFNQNMINNNKN